VTRIWSASNLLLVHFDLLRSRGLRTGPTNMKDMHLKDRKRLGCFVLESIHRGPIMSRHWGARVVPSTVVRRNAPKQWPDLCVEYGIVK
jgi:hypothetical protein